MTPNKCYTDVEEVWDSKPSSSTVYTDLSGSGLAQTALRQVYLWLNILLAFLSLGCGSTKGPGADPDRSPAEVKIDRIALDQLGQLYVVTSDNEVIQYRVDGSRGFSYNNNTLGRLAVVDPTNPFAILLYYPDFQTIVLLDRTLNEQSRISLSTLGLIDIELVALGNDNFIWLYDAVDVQLKKLDREGNISFRTDPLNQLLREIPRPDQLLAVNNYLLLSDPVRGIFVFDRYGRYETTLPVLGAESLQMIGEHRLVYMTDGSIYSYDLRALEPAPVDLKISCDRNCQLKISNAKVYWLENGILQQRNLQIAP